MRFKAFDYYSWHRWFAWRPVQTGDEWVWLETVERRHVFPEVFYTYRLPGDRTEGAASEA